MSTLDDSDAGVLKIVFQKKHWPRQEITSFGADMEKRGPLGMLVGKQIGSAPVENSVGVPQKNENTTTI